MRIAIDGRAIMPQLDGIGRYSHCLIEGLRQLDTRNEYIVYVTHPHFSFPSDSNFREALLPYRYVHPYTIMAFHRELHAQKVDLLFAPFFFAPPLFRGPTILTVHDLIWVKQPGLQAKPGNPLELVKIIAHRTIVPYSLRRAAEVITVSHSTAADLHRLDPSLSDRVTVITPGIDHLPCGEDPLPLSDRDSYVLFVGNSKPYKNMAGVIECFERLTANEPFDTLRLKIPGRRDNFRTIIQEQINRSSCRDRVDLLGPVDEVSLVDLYRRARLLLFPSRYEGFGFPVLEAMAFGTPVVTSNCSSLPEVAGDAAVLVDPEDIPQMARACAALLGDPVRMQSLVERGRRRVLDYRWEECARQVHAVLLRAGRPFLGA